MATEAMAAAPAPPRPMRVIKLKLRDKVVVSKVLPAGERREGPCKGQRGGES